MAIVINDHPDDYSSAHGDLLFSVYEATKAVDPVTYPDYKYVCDIYIAGDLKERKKIPPNPVHFRGVFNIAPIVRSYIAAQLNPAGAGIEAQEFGNGEFFIDVQVKFGEEYNFTLTPALEVDSVRRYYNHYNGQIIDDETVLGDYLDEPLSNRPSRGAVRANDPYFFVPYFVKTGTVFGLAVTTYDASGNAINNDSTTFSASNGTMQLLNLCPIAIDVDFPTLGILNAGVAYYEIEIEGTTYYTFDIKCESIYEPFTIHFLNQLGGFESMCFNKVSRTSYDIERKSFSKLPYSVNSSTGVIEYHNAGNVVNEIKNVYASLQGKKMKFNTDLLTDAEWVWLKELVFSPDVFVTIGSFIVPITITQTNYEEKKFITDRLNPLQIEVDFGAMLNTQFR